jgi:EmrB/QacA subfamily drug resistance transporter
VNGVAVDAVPRSGAAAISGAAIAAAAIEKPRWAVLGVTSLALFAVYLDTTILFVAFPSISATFPDVSAGGLSWILNAYTIVFGSLLVPAGQLADRAGRRRLFLAGTWVFTLGSALCGLAPSVPVLVAARVLQAIGAAMLIPSSLALVLAAVPREKRAIGVSIWGAVGALSAAVGPALGSAIVEHASWRWAFLINLPVGAAALLLGRRVLVESRDPGAHGRPDVAGVLLLVSGLGLAALAIVQGPDWGWSDGRTLGTLAAAVVLLICFVLESRVSISPVVDFALFRDRNFQLANLAILFYAMAFNAMFLGFVFFLTRVWHYSIFEAGLAITPGPLTVMLVAIGSGKFAARRGHRPLIVVGGLVFAAGGLLLAHAPLAPSFLRVWLPSAIFTGIGVGLVFPSLNGAAVHGLPPGRFGLGSAVNQAVRQIGSVLGVAVTIAILTADPGPSGLRHVFEILTGVGLLVSLIGLGIRTAPVKG